MYQHDDANYIAESVMNDFSELLKEHGIKLPGSDPNDPDDTISSKEYWELRYGIMWHLHTFERECRQTVTSGKLPYSPGTPPHVINTLPDEVTVLPMTEPVTAGGKYDQPVALVVINTETDPTLERYGKFELTLPTIANGWVVLDLTAINPTLNKNVCDNGYKFCMVEIENHKLTDNNHNIIYLFDNDVTPEIWAAHAAHFKAYPWLITQNSSTDKATQAKYLAELEK